MKIFNYILKLEDDIVFKENFIESISEYIEQNSDKKKWMCMEFSKLGLYGKLFKCSQLKYFVNFF